MATVADGQWGNNPDRSRVMESVLKVLKSVGTTKVKKPDAGTRLNAFGLEIADDTDVLHGLREEFGDLIMVRGLTMSWTVDRLVTEIISELASAADDSVYDPPEPDEWSESDA